MSKYAFLRGNASLVIVGLLLGLVLGFKAANSQYRRQQGESLSRAVAQATSDIPDQQGAREEVTKIIDRAKANPNDAEAQVQAAIQFIQIERPQEALPFLEQARKTSPNDSRVSAGFGISYFIMGQFDQAVEWLTRARGQGADDPVVTSFLIGSYIQTRKNLDEAGRLLAELEGKGLDPSRLARIRDELNAARSPGAGAPGATPAANTTLGHGPSEPKVGK
jgi:tetratricopeptide (TPR) repeat protein